MRWLDNIRDSMKEYKMNQRIRIRNEFILFDPRKKCIQSNNEKI